MTGIAATPCAGATQPHPFELGSPNGRTEFAALPPAGADADADAGMGHNAQGQEEHSSIDNGEGSGSPARQQWQAKDAASAPATPPPPAPAPPRTLPAPSPFMRQLGSGVLRELLGHGADATPSAPPVDAASLSSFGTAASSLDATRVHPWGWGSAGFPPINTIAPAAALLPTATTTSADAAAAAAVPAKRAASAPAPALGGQSSSDRRPTPADISAAEAALLRVQPWGSAALVQSMGSSLELELELDAAACIQSWPSGASAGLSACSSLDAARVHPLPTPLPPSPASLPPGGVERGGSHYPSAGASQPDAGHTAAQLQLRLQQELLAAASAAAAAAGTAAGGPRRRASSSAARMPPADSVTSEWMISSNPSETDSLGAVPILMMAAGPGVPGSSLPGWARAEAAAATVGGDAAMGPTTPAAGVGGWPPSHGPLDPLGSLELMAAAAVVGDVGGGGASQGAPQPLLATAGSSGLVRSPRVLVTAGPSPAEAAFVAALDDDVPAADNGAVECDNKDNNNNPLTAAPLLLRAASSGQMAELSLGAARSAGSVGNDAGRAGDDGGDSASDDGNDGDFLATFDSPVGPAAASYVYRTPHAAAAASVPLWEAPGDAHAHAGSGHRHQAASSGSGGALPSVGGTTCTAGDPSSYGCQQPSFSFATATSLPLPATSYEDAPKPALAHAVSAATPSPPAAAAAAAVDILFAPRLYPRTSFSPTSSPRTSLSGTTAILLPSGGSSSPRPGELSVRTGGGRLQRPAGLLVPPTSPLSSKPSSALSSPTPLGHYASSAAASPMADAKWVCRCAGLARDLLLVRLDLGQRCPHGRSGRSVLTRCGVPSHLRHTHTLQLLVAVTVGGIGPHHQMHQRAASAVGAAHLATLFSTSATFPMQPACPWPRPRPRPHTLPWRAGWSTGPLPPPPGLNSADLACPSPVPRSRACCVLLLVALHCVLCVRAVHRQLSSIQRTLEMTVTSCLFSDSDSDNDEAEE